jgi:dipeptidase
METYKQGDQVVIHSMGDGLEYDGEINGISVDFGDTGHNIWIVEILSSHGQFEKHPFTHFSITGDCLRLK